MKKRFLRHTPLFAAFCVLMACAGCHSSQQEEITDPVTTYSIIKTDSSSGIAIVSETASNPMKVRAFIDQYPIPEQSYTEKRRKFYELLDRLSLLSQNKDTLAYNEVDSLNYMAIHYLTNLLEDKLSLTSPIRHRALKINSSTDKRLNIYSWNENIGYETYSYINVFQYRCDDRQLKASFNKEINSDNELNISSGKIEKICMLPSSGQSEQYYLLLISGTQGSNGYKGAGLLLLDNDTLLFDQPLLGPQAGSPNSLVFHYQQEKEVRMWYDSKKKQLHIGQLHTKEGDTDTLSQAYRFEQNHFQAVTE